MEKISVAIRVRPPSKVDVQSPSGRGHKWSIGPHNVSLYSTLGTPVNGQNYSFDHVFGVDAKNGDIYGGLAKDVIMSAINGFNGTVFAYGQTSSGKTYTMKGTQADPGIIRLAVHDVFGHIRQLANKREFLIRVSYMEIYNEEINDLFAPHNRRLQIHENLEKGIFVAGLREEIVDSPEQVFDLLEFGESHRHFGETNMNLYSSRSHTIFRMVIESRDTSQDGCESDAVGDAVRVSCLNMVDLAGSERIAKTGAGGVRLKEGTHINKSLMTLGTVINKLSDGTGKQGGHIPYRDSKLTRILQPALGGNAKTAMICTVTPDEIHIDETRGTLQFASRAKRVSTCAKVNEIVTDAALLKRQAKEIEDLRYKLQGLPQSAHLEKEILTLRNELLKFELEKERLYLELQEEKKAQVARERHIKEQELKIENLSTLFRTSTLDDRDGEKLLKKVNRRETWCSRQLSSELALQDFRISSGKVEDNETMDSLLYSMRRDRNFTLPPAFQIDEDSDSFWNSSNEIEEPDTPSEFENIADEDTWMSLNKGHTTTSSAVFFSGFSERNRSSAGSGAAQKAALLDRQLKELQSQHDELKSSCDAKIEESTKVFRQELERSKHYLDKVLKENAVLKDKLRAQLEKERELLHAFEDLESEMDAARLLTCSMQGVLAESLHVQANALVTLQDCVPLISTKGKSTTVSSYANLGTRARDRRLSIENSVQKCREICAGIDHVLQDLPSRTQGIITESSSPVLNTNPTLRSLRENAAPGNTMSSMEIPGVGDTGNDDVKDAEGLRSPHLTSKEKPTEVFDSTDLADAGEEIVTFQPKYCKGCLSSLLSASKIWCNEPTEFFNDSQYAPCQGKRAGETPLDLLAPSEGHELPGNSNSISLDSLTRGHCNTFRAHALRVLALESEGSAENGSFVAVDASVGRTGIWSGFSACGHVGCSFGTLGKNCDSCADHERKFMGENQIPATMSTLCGLILKLFGPSNALLDAVRVQDNLKDTTAQESGKLNAHLASAKLLATWLLEEVQFILQHDIDCLKYHVKERGNVGVLLQGLQVLLLQNANLAIGLLPTTCQHEDLRDDLLLQLSSLKDAKTSKQVPCQDEDARKDLPLQQSSVEEVKKNIQSVATGISEVDIGAPRFQQADTTVHKAPKPVFVEERTTEFDSDGIAAEIQISRDFYERELKVEAVEEMLGKVLHFSMGLLSKEHRVMEGRTMFIVLKLRREVSTEGGSVNKSLVAPNKSRPESNASTPRHLDSVSRGSTVLNEVWSQQRQSISNFERSFGNQRKYVEAVSVGLLPNRSSVDQFCVGNPGTDVEPTCSNPAFVNVRGICELVDVCTLGDQSFSCSRKAEQGLENELLIKLERVRELEFNLAAAELEVVELKIELEDSHAQMRTHADYTAKQMEGKLNFYRIKCKKYEVEICRLKEEVPTVAENLRKERQLTEIINHNRFLQRCLAKAKKHVLRSKTLRDEIRKRRDDDINRHEIGGKAEGFTGNGFHSAAVPLPESSQKNAVNVEDSRQRQVRPVLRQLDLNLRNDIDSNLRTDPKRRRHLHFSGTENIS